MTTERVAERRVVGGTPGAPGVARGPWARYERVSLVLGGRIPAEGVEVEVRRLVAAAEAVAVASEALAEAVRRDGHTGEADIFEAHAAMARDPELIDTAGRHIRTELLDGSAAIAASAEATAN